MPFGEIIFDLHADDGADAGEGVDHDADQRAIAQPDEQGTSLPTRRQGDLLFDLDAGEQLSGLFLAQHRRLAALDDVLRPAHRMRRVDGENLADDQPVEQHADRGQMLLDGRP